MKLSMWIFADRLKQYDPECHISFGKFSIETVRLFSDTEQSDASTLYVGRQKDFFPEGDDFIVCKNQEDLLFLATTDLKDVMNRVLIIMELFARWEGNMMERLSSGAMAQDLFQGSLHIFSHPMFLLDQDQHLLAHSSNYKIGEVNEQWDAMLTHGSSNRIIWCRSMKNIPRDFPIRVYFQAATNCIPISCLNIIFSSATIGWALLPLSTSSIISPGRNRLLFSLLQISGTLVPKLYPGTSFSSAGIPASGRRNRSRFRNSRSAQPADSKRLADGRQSYIY